MACGHVPPEGADLLVEAGGFAVFVGQVANLPHWLAARSSARWPAGPRAPPAARRFSLNLRLETDR